MRTYGIFTRADMFWDQGTLVKAAAVLKENGAKSVLALVTHGILSGSAIETLNGSVLSALVVTNTVPLGDKVQRVSLAESVRPL
jgi:ribose-phosphate pyrophosphokinase